jgi:sulfate permease
LRPSKKGMAEIGLIIREMIAGGYLWSLGLPCVLALFLAVVMGGSGTAPAFSAAYGARVLSRRWIPIFFGVMVLAGAVLAGGEVSISLGQGLMRPELFTPFTTSVILLAVGLSVFVAGLLGVPQSTSQSTVLSISGAALALDGLEVKKLLLEIIPTWLILPAVAFVVMYMLSRWVFPFIRDRVITDDYAHLEEHGLLKLVLVLSCLYTAFSIGANNVANAAAPLASLMMNTVGDAEGFSLSRMSTLAVWMAAPCFGLGSYWLGYRVTKTTGTQIVDVGPFHATVIGLLVASLLLYASLSKGIPTSLVQLSGASFIALSASRYGFRETYRNGTVRRFFVVWGIAPAFSFLFTYGIIFLFGAS